MDRLDGIAAFAQVVDTGSFTAAARRLGLSKSAVSAHIQRLEDRLGVQLLRRTTRRVAATEAGRTYHRYCIRILADAEAAEQAAGALQREPRGTLRISAPESFGWMHVAPAIAGFRERFPDIAIDLNLDERHINLVQDGVDLAIRIGVLPSSPLVVRKLAPARLVLCASPGYVAAHGEPQSPQDLSDRSCLCFPPLWRDGRWRLAAGAREERIPITAALISNSGEVLRVAALGGAGIAMLPTWAVGEDLRSGALSRVLPAWSPQTSAIHAVYPDNRRMSAKVRTFVDHLVRHFGRTPYWDRGL